MPSRPRPASELVRPSRSPISRRGSVPRTSERPSRTMPLRSSTAVRTMSTLLSGSSTQSTGTSWIRRPARSATTSSSVSKNHALSSTSGQQLPGRVAADRLEAALRVAEPGAQRLAQQQVVAARDELPLRAALHPRVPGEPRPDRQVGVAADQRRDQGEQRGEVGGEVDVHVDEHVALRGAPHPLERPAPALLGQVHDRDLGVGVAEPAGDQRGLVGAGVVGDGDPEGPRHRAQVLEHPLDRRRELRLLVVDRDHHVEHGGRGQLR